MVGYLVIYEKNKQGHYSAYIPDLPGCTSYGDTLKEVKENVKVAIDLYIEELKADGQVIPLPSTSADTCNVEI